MYQIITSDGFYWSFESLVQAVKYSRWDSNVCRYAAIVSGSRLVKAL